jgi:phosphatidylglycerophosphatase A
MSCKLLFVLPSWLDPDALCAMHRAISDRLALGIATGGYAGYTRIAPGTVGSLVGLLLYIAFAATPALIQVALVGALFGVGVWAADQAERIVKIVDPPQVVVDEIVGMWVAVLFLPHRIGYLLGAFLLFRLFDIVKPFPAKQAERLHGGWGIMTDDVIAALYANGALQVVAICQRLLSAG